MTSSEQSRLKEVGRRVLMVDDDVATLGTFRMVFRDREDFALEVAMNASEALMKLSSGNFDAIVADFGLVGPNGDWLLRKVRDRHPAMRRVLLSGQDYARISSSLEPGLVDVFVPKPVELDELLAALS